MGSSFAPTEWKDRARSEKDSTAQGSLALLSEVPRLALAEDQFVSVSSWVGACRYAVQRSGSDDFEIADDIGISHGYISKVLKGTAGLYGPRLVRFMRRTGSLAPLQWLAWQLGCEVVQRDRVAAEIATLRARLTELEHTGRCAA